MSFGKYFKSLRIKKNIRQKEIADCIGKSAMLVSGVENEKNGPFIEEDLIKISRCLGLSKKEEELLFIEAAIERGTLPGYLAQYMIQYRESYKLLAVLKEKKYKNKDISELIRKLEEN